MIYNRYPYSDNEQTNLDWLIRVCESVQEASGISYDDAITLLNAGNVQEAIEKLKDLIDQTSASVSAFRIIESDLSESAWISGQVFTHIQTVNDPTLTAIAEAVRSEKYIILIRQTASNEATYFFLDKITEVPGDYLTNIYFRDLVTRTTSHLKIYGINNVDNIYAETEADASEPVVNSFNGRSGSVLPVSGDYAASDIAYDNTGSGLTATDVQDAIDEVKSDIPGAAAEISYDNSQSGLTATDVQDAIDEVKSDIPGAASEITYDNSQSGLTATDVQNAIDEVKSDIPGAASEITYDNSQSGLTATDVQDALDEIANDILSSGVASFNGRTGAVNPQSGDYNASMISIDTTNTDLPGTITNLQQYLEYIHPAAVTITLTLNGAKEDSITIKDSSNNTIGTCVFASGQTTGTITTTVPSGYSDTWTFTSSVSKDTTTGTSDFVKTATVTDTSAQTINVMPDNVLYWYGNEISTFVAKAVWSSAPGSPDVLTAPTLTRNTNSLVITQRQDDSNYADGMGTVFISAVLTGMTDIKCNCSGNASNVSSWAQGILGSADTDVQGYTTHNNVKIVAGSSAGNIPSFTGIKTTSAETTDSFVVFRTSANTITLDPIVLTINALWLE